MVLRDFAGNAVTLRGEQSSPTVEIHNTDIDRLVSQTIKRSGKSDDAWIEMAAN